MERQALLPLPSTCYVFSEWKKAKANIDYHVELKGHYYSAPYTLVRESPDIRYTISTVEVFSRGKRVDSHRPSHEIGRHTALKDHMPKSLKWNPSRIICLYYLPVPFSSRIICLYYLPVPFCILF